MTNPYTFIRNCWYVAGLSKEFKAEKLTGHKIANRPMVIWRTKEGKVVAFDNRCAHKRFPLSEGRLMDDGSLECAYHGLRYNDAGRCIAIPSQPDGKIPPQAKLNPFPIMEQNGLIWVWPGDPAKSNLCKPPLVPEIDDDEWETIDSGPMEVTANYLLLIENLLDITHFYPLHDGNIGDIENSRIPIEYEEGEIDGNKFIKTIRQVQNYKQPPYLVDWFVYEEADRDHTHCMMSPGITRVVMRNAPPGELGTDMERGYVLMHTHTPVDENNHVWHWIVSCKKDHMSGGDPNMSAAKRVAVTFPKVVDEDRWALKLQQQMLEIPDGEYSELFLKPDKALRRARQIFLQLIREEQTESKHLQAAE